jgi:predicted dehydrogenase
LVKKVGKYSAAVVGVGSRNSSGTTSGGYRIGYTHAQTYGLSTSVDLTACMDINEENLAAFQNEFGVSNGYTDLTEMLTKARPDIVSVCTYVGHHAHVIEECAKAGVRGIVCEKPFLASPAEIDRIRAVVAETGIKVVVAHVRRYLRAFEHAAELYRGGAVGDPIVCIAGIQDWDLSEWGSHWLDMFRFFAGDQDLVYVMGQAKVTQRRGFGHAMEDHAVAYFEFADGSRGILDGGRRLAGEETMLLVGTMGVIRIYNESRLEVQTREGTTTADYSDPEAWQYAWSRLLSDLVAWIEGAPAPMVGLPNQFATSELNLGAYLSALRRTRIDLPLRDDCAEWPLEALGQRE